MYGKKHSEQTKRKISEKAIGRIMSDEARKKISEKNKGKIVSEETRKKMSDWQKDGKSPMLGKKLSESTKEKIKQHWVEFGHPFTGRNHTEETKQKLRELSSARCGEKSLKNQIVGKFVNGEKVSEYYSMTEAARQNNCTISTISSYVRGKRNPKDGSIWKKLN